MGMVRVTSEVITYNLTEINLSFFDFFYKCCCFLFKRIDSKRLKSITLIFVKKCLILY